MHYRDGTPVELGDKVTVADRESTGPLNFEKIPDYYLSEQGKKDFTGTVIGRDTTGTCGVAILRPTSDMPFAMYPAICSQSSLGQLVLLQGKLTLCAPQFLKKLS